MATKVGTCIQTTAESRAKIWSVKYIFKPYPAVPSSLVVDLLLLLMFVGAYVWVEF